MKKVFLFSLLFLGLVACDKVKDEQVAPDTTTVPEAVSARVKQLFPTGTDVQVQGSHKNQLWNVTLKDGDTYALMLDNTGVLKSLYKQIAATKLSATATATLKNTQVNATIRQVYENLNEAKQVIGYAAIVTDTKDSRKVFLDNAGSFMFEVTDALPTTSNVESVLTWQVLRINILRLTDMPQAVRDYLTQNFPNVTPVATNAVVYDDRTELHVIISRNGQTQVLVFTEAGVLISNNNSRLNTPTGGTPATLASLPSNIRTDLLQRFPNWTFVSAVRDAAGKIDVTIKVVAPVYVVSYDAAGNFLMSRRF
jgi:hypothetical protein